MKQIANIFKRLTYLPKGSLTEKMFKGTHSINLFMKASFLLVCFINMIDQPVIACSKLTIKTPEQGVKYVQS